MIYYLPILNYSLYRVKEMVMVKRNSDFLKHCHTSKLRLLLIFLLLFPGYQSQNFRSMKTFSRQYDNNPFSIEFFVSPLRAQKKEVTRKGCSLKDTQSSTFWEEPDVGFSYRLFWARISHRTAGLLFLEIMLSFKPKCFLVQSSNKIYPLPLIIWVCTLQIFWERERVTIPL